MKNHQKIVVKI